SSGGRLWLTKQEAGAPWGDSLPKQAQAAVTKLSSHRAMSSGFRRAMVLPGEGGVVGPSVGSVESSATTDLLGVDAGEPQVDLVDPHHAVVEKLHGVSKGHLDPLATHLLESGREAGVAAAPRQGHLTGQDGGGQPAVNRDGLAVVVRDGPHAIVAGFTRQVVRAWPEAAVDPA